MIKFLSTDLCDASHKISLLNYCYLQISDVFIKSQDLSNRNRCVCYNWFEWYFICVWELAGLCRIGPSWVFVRGTLDGSDVAKLLIGVDGGHFVRGRGGTLGLPVLNTRFTSRGLGQAKMEERDEHKGKRQHCSHLHVHVHECMNIVHDKFNRAAFDITTLKISDGSEALRYSEKKYLFIYYITYFYVIFFFYLVCNLYSV